MSYKTRREKNEHGVERIVISWGDRDCYEVGMGACKSGTWIHRLDDDFGRADPDVMKRPLGYLYAGVDHLIAEALNTFIAERAAWRQAQAEAEVLRRKTCQKLEHCGAKVDLSCAATYDALSSIEARKAMTQRSFGPWTDVEIRYRGRWMTLCRTDLMDDVCTGRSVPADCTADDFVRHMRDSAGFGARLKRYADGRECFAVVDSISDG